MPADARGPLPPLDGVLGCALSPGRSRGAWCPSGSACGSTPWTSGPASVAALIHGVIFGRVAPPSSQRRTITARALVVGHPKDPIHPFADAAMLAEELPYAEFVEAQQPPGVAGPPRAAQRGRGRVRAVRAGPRARRRPAVVPAVGRVARGAPPPDPPAGAADWPGASLPRRGGRAAHPQAGRGGPHHHPADPPARPGPRGGEGRAQDDVAVGVAARAVHPRRPAAGRRPVARHRHPGRDDRAVRGRAGRATTSATPPAR